MDINDYLKEEVNKYKDQHPKMNKYEVLRDIMDKIIDHRSLIMSNDELTESTRLELCIGVDDSITQILNIFNE